MNPARRPYGGLDGDPPLVSSELPWVSPDDDSSDDDYH